MEPWFDTVAKMFAEGVGTRRQALRWVGGIIGGAMLGSLSLPTQGWGQVSRHCQRFCRENYPGRGPRARRNREHCKAVCTRCEQLGSEECLTPAPDPTKPPVTRCLCGDTCCSNGQTCCGRAAVGNESAICCPKGACCVSNPEANIVNVNCCLPGEKCTLIDGCCPPDRVCGEICCPEDQVCENDQCVVCPSSRSLRTANGDTICCPPEHVPCGEECCAPNEECQNEVCVAVCPPGRSVCPPFDRCCSPEHFCCGGFCCPRDATYCCIVGDLVFCCPNGLSCCSDGCRPGPCS